MENVKNWVIKERDSFEEMNQLSTSLQISTSLTNLLLNKGIKTFEEAKNYFRPSIQLLHDPFKMDDMKKAVERLSTALHSNETILLYGDYDVDGTTSVALCYLFLSQYFEQIHYYVPDRYEEGYGVSKEGVEYAEEKGVSLIITLDCGITSFKAIKCANEKGIECIVCDHHEPKRDLPSAFAILNPKKKSCDYPYKDLSGCGVGFKLLQGFCLEEEIPLEEITPFLPLLALSISADIVPMTGENRILTYYGLKEFKSLTIKGLKALVQLNKVDSAYVNVGNLVFGIAPTINAAGRIFHAKKAVELLICQDEEKAYSIAKQLVDFNTSRKELDKQMSSEALSLIKTENLENHFSTVLFQKHWNKGVVGITASRLIEKYHRPTIVLTESNGKACGSARSIKGFNLLQALEKCSELFDQFGGHQFAAGMNMPIENVPLFKTKFEEIVKKYINKDDLIPTIEIDLEIELDDISPKFLRIIEQMAPFGPKNKRPVFLCKNVIIEKDFIIKKSHLKGIARKHNQEKEFDIIGFGLAEKFKNLKTQKHIYDLCFVLNKNTFRGIEKWQLELRDIK